MSKYIVGVDLGRHKHKNRYCHGSKRTGCEGLAPY